LELTYESRISKPIVVHLRLGDLRNLSHLYEQPKIPNLRKHLVKLRQTNTSPLWLFTDSPEDLPASLLNDIGVAKLIGPKILTSPLENLNLMSSGSHLFCSNSTFSWWAAFLNRVPQEVSVPFSGSSRISIFREEMIMDGWKIY
jgi:hypothetical protein